MRKTKIVNHLTNDDLKIRYESAVDKEIRKRWHMLWLVQAMDYPVSKASIIVGYKRSWGKYWVKQYNQKGSSAIVMPKLRNPAWAKQKVSEEMKAHLLDKLSEEVPDAIGGGLWSGPKVAAYLEHRYGVSITRKTGWMVLKECGYSVTTVRPRHKKTPDKEKEYFKKNVTREDKVCKEVSSN